MPPPVTNRLIESLPAVYRDVLLASMEPITLAVSARVCGITSTPKFAHFPTSGIVSAVTETKSGDGVEVGLIGREGLVESFSLLGGAMPTFRSFVQMEGTALRLPFAELQRQFETCEPLRAIVLGYVQTQGYASAQLTTCNRLHEVAPRMARWLLMVYDRVGVLTFPLTQEFLANMLGSNRTTVTLAAQRLHAAGLIDYSRGIIHLVDRKGLESAACECYPILRRLTPRQTTAAA